MQVTKGTWRMCKQCVPGSLSSSPAQEPGNEANARDELNIRANVPSPLFPKTIVQKGGAYFRELTVILLKIGESVEESLVHLSEKATIATDHLNSNMCIQHKCMYSLVLPRGSPPKAAMTRMVVSEM